MGIRFQNVGLGSFNVSGHMAVRLDPPNVNRWMSMGYPMKKDIKIKLIFLFYEILCK